MLVSRILSLGAAAVSLALAATPAQAQFFFKSPDLRAAPVTGAEPGIVGQSLPGATQSELRAALLWNLRAALNVAALQCQFEPTLLTLDSYNGMLKSHGRELADSYDTLTGYFLRTAPSKKAGQTALDQYGTRVYSGFSTVAAQLTFCETAGDLGTSARFVPVGGLSDFAARHMQELRNSLVPGGEQQFPAYYPVSLSWTPEFGNSKCWRGDVYRPDRCRKR